MVEITAERPRPANPPVLEPDAILAALAAPVFVVDDRQRLCFLNAAAEQFFQTSMSALAGRPLAEVLPEDSPICSLIGQVLRTGHSVTEYGIVIETPKIGPYSVAVTAAVLGELPPERVVLSLHERSMARRMDRQLVHRSAARSITAMAAMLAHELRNPLSGIRGAAQLLEQDSDPSSRRLTRLICDEADRIVSLVDRMEMFSSDRPPPRTAVNVHEVMNHVRRLAQSGFARNIHFREDYDPSLPAVYGNRDLLIQAILNLIKNAAEAIGDGDGEILLASRYRHGVRLALPGQGVRVDLPISLEIRDNGPGIPQDLRNHLFEAFVTNKPGGKGLGLALVAKIVDDHGGIIEFDSRPRRTVFRLRLPIAPEEGE